MRVKVFAIALAGLTMTVSLGAAAPKPAVQQYYPGPGIYCLGYDRCYPIAYNREIYSDPELTNLIGQGADSCVGSDPYVFITTPQLPAGYEVATPAYVCTGSGPYLPPDF